MLHTKVVAVVVVSLMLSLSNTAFAAWVYSYNNIFTVKTYSDQFEVGDITYDFSIQANILLDERIEANKTYQWYDMLTSGINYSLNHPLSLPYSSPITGALPLPGDYLANEYGYRANVFVTTDNSASIIDWKFTTLGSILARTAPGYDEYFFSGGLVYVTGSTTTNGQWTEIYVESPNATPVPEPETYAMLIAGLGLLSFATRRKV